MFSALCHPRHRLMLFAALLLLPLNLARAESTVDAAENYKNCILELRHISEDQMNGVISNSGDIESKAALVADIAVSTCSNERAQLLNLLKSEGKIGSKYDKLVTDIEDMSKFSVRFHIFNLAVKAKSKSSTPQ